MKKDIICSTILRTTELYTFKGWGFPGFPGGAVVKNPPPNAGNKGSSPGLGGSHMLWSNEARAPQLLSLHSRAREPRNYGYPHA